MATAVTTFFGRRKQRRRRGRQGSELIGTRAIYELLKKAPDTRSEMDCAFITKYLESKSEFKAFVESMSIDKELREIHLADFAQHVQLMKLKKDGIVFYQGEVAYSWFFIFKGDCSIYVYTPDDTPDDAVDNIPPANKDTDFARSMAATKPSHRKRKRKLKVFPVVAKATVKTPEPAMSEEMLKHTKGDTSHLYKPIEPLPDFVMNIDRFNPDRSQLGHFIAKINAGESFGQLSLLQKRRRAATIISEEVELLVLDKPDYDRIIRPIHEGKNTCDLKVHYLRHMEAFRRLIPKHLMHLTMFIQDIRLRPRQALFNQNEKAKFMYIVTSGSMMLSERKFHASSDATNIAERHEIEECPPLTLIGIKHAFETRTIARFEYDCTALEEGATLMAIPKETIITLYNEKALRMQPFLLESYKYLELYATRRLKWHDVRIAFCKTYSDLTLCLTRKVQLAHYAQCGKCGRSTHDALDTYMCPSNGVDGMPPLSSEEIQRKDKKQFALDTMKYKETSKLLPDKVSFPLNSSATPLPSLKPPAPSNDTLFSSDEREKMLRLAAERCRKHRQKQQQNEDDIFGMDQIQKESAVQPVEYAHTPARPATMSHSKPGAVMHHRRRVVYTPLIPFLDPSPTPDERHGMDLTTHNMQVLSNRHQQAITLNTNGPKYGHHCKIMLTEKYPHLSIAESHKYTLKSVVCCLCNNKGHTKINCPRAPVSAIEQRKRLGDVMAARKTLHHL